MFRIETPRLVIRTWSPEDRPVYAAITSDPVVMRHLSGGRAHTEEEIDQFFERQERQLREHGVCMGALVERTSGAVIGIAGIQPLGTTPDLEIGWILGREFWGRGYATEAGKAA
ncbi:MAG TPA: GNAT family N-acetyltransferase, partial [Thermoanaerobaculia bacterium]|nr:GNAT family N-acetyltransferase [Thermoanaerobaculia bacterium]